MDELRRVFFAVERRVDFDLVEARRVDFFAAGRDDLEAVRRLEGRALLVRARRRVVDGVRRLVDEARRLVDEARRLVDEARRVVRAVRLARVVRERRLVLRVVGMA